MSARKTEWGSAAVDAFHAGGGFLFPFRHGYAELERLLEQMPPETWRRDEAVLSGLVLSLSKRGQVARAKSYLTAVDLEFEKTDQFALLELLLTLHLGEPVSDRKLGIWRRLERTLPMFEPLLLGLYYNAMMAMYVRLGRIKEARIAGQLAISCYREDGHLYLEHFIHIHLADLDVIEGRLHSARQGVTTAKRCLAQSGLRYGNEAAIIAVIELAIDYERGDLSGVRDQATELRNSLLNGDSWSELFLQLGRIAVLSRYFMEGRAAALEELARFHADYTRRHHGDASAMDALRALILHLEWHSDAAERTWEQAREHPIHSALGKLLTDELGRSLGLAGPVPSKTPRSLVLDALQLAKTTRGKHRREALEHALRLAFEQGQIAPFLEHRDVFLGSQDALARGQAARATGRLGRFTNKVLRLVADSYVVPEPLRRMGFNHRQYRVAAALQSGATNKQVARQLGTTEATVKYHLTSLYRLTGARRRNEFIDIIEKIEVSLNS